MKKIISIMLILLLFGCSSNSYKVISANDAHQMMEDDDKVVLIDVRETNEYAESHILGSKNIPLGEINNIDLDKDTTIILYCLSGVRSQKAAESLISMGYTSVYSIDGGIINWGYELESE